MSKEIIIIAGGNGVGKTTFAREFLRENPHYEFLNADEIAKEISPDNPQNSKISAGKAFFKKLDEYVNAGKSFMIETTLSGRYLIKFIEIIRARNYEIRIIFLFVDSSDILIDRVKERVKRGGHFVPDEDVHRRFKRGKQNFWKEYRAIVDEWFLYYNSKGNFQLTATGENNEVDVVDKDIFEKFLT